MEKKFIVTDNGRGLETKETKEFTVGEISALLKVIDGKERLNLSIEERIENIKGELMAIVFTANEKETDEEGNEFVISYLLTLPGQRYESDGTPGRVVDYPFLAKDYDGGVYSKELADYKDGKWTNVNKE